MKYDAVCYSYHNLHQSLQHIIWRKLSNVVARLNWSIIPFGSGCRKLNRTTVLNSADYLSVAKCRVCFKSYVDICTLISALSSAGDTCTFLYLN